MTPTLLLGLSLVASQGLGYASPYLGATAELRAPFRVAEARLAVDWLAARKIGESSGQGLRIGVEVLGPTSWALRPLVGWRRSLQAADTWSKNRTAAGVGLEIAVGRVRIRATAEGDVGEGGDQIEEIAGRLDLPIGDDLFRIDVSRVDFDQGAGPGRGVRGLVSFLWRIF